MLQRWAWIPVCMGSLAGANCATTQLAGKEQEHPVLLSAPVSIGEGNTGKAPSRRKPDPEPGETTRSAEHGFLPDPQPLATPHQWEYVLELQHGTLKIAGVKRRVFATSVVTQRQMGRFAFELWIGKELVERVRFDFPLLGAEAPPSGRTAVREAPRFEPGLEASRTILVPDSPRAVRAQIVDRATGDILPVPWPPGSTPAESAPVKSAPDEEKGSAPASTEEATTEAAP